MENQPYLACIRLLYGPNRWSMHPVVSRADSFTAADQPIMEEPSPAPSPKPAPAPRPVRSAKAVKHLTMMKALASRARLTAIELCLDGSVFTATALQTPMRMSARRVADHMKILCKVGVLQRRRGSNDKRETEYVINPGYVRKAEDGTAIFDFGSGQLHFPKVRLNDKETVEKN